jgi:hypothetical protein
MSTYGPEFDRLERCLVVLSGQRTATVEGIPLTLPDWACTISNVHVTARASGGTDPTCTVDIKAGATSKLAAPVSVTAGSWTAGTPHATPSITAAAVLTATLTIGGDTPTWDDIAIRFDLLRTW